MESLVLLAKHGILWSLVLVSLCSRRWSLPILAFALPVSQWLPAVPVPGVNAVNLLLLPPLIRAFFAGSDPGKARRLDPILPTAMVVLVFVTISWARVRFAEELPLFFLQWVGQDQNLIAFKEILLFPAFYFCGRRLTREPEDLRRTVAWAFGGFLFEAATASKEFLLGSSWRATAHLGQPNKLGSFLSGYGMIPVGFLLGGRGRWFLLAASATAMTVLGLLGAVSRGSLLAAGLAVLILAGIRRSPWLIVFAIIIGTSPAWLPDKVMQRFDSSFEVDATTGEQKFDTEHEGRVQLWQSAGRLLQDRPVLGVGLGLFQFHLREYGYTHHKIKSTHNIYLQLATEQGLPCAIAHLIMMLTLLALALRVGSRLRSTFEGHLAFGFAGCVIAFMISSSFGDGFYENNLTGVFWILGGIIVNLDRGFGVTKEPVQSDPPLSKKQ